MKKMIKSFYKINGDILAKYLIGRKDFMQKFSDILIFVYLSNFRNDLICT